MNKKDVMDQVQKQVSEWGVPSHLFSLKPVPARVELDVVVGGERRTLKLRSGITQMELNEKLAMFGHEIAMRDGTVDLEEAIEAKEIV